MPLTRDLEIEANGRDGDLVGINPKSAESTTHSAVPLKNVPVQFMSLLKPLLLDNSDSDCRDHCMNERTFLSYLRLSIYMTIVSIAILISFHIQHAPSALELRLSLPLGLVFWALGVTCLAAGTWNYWRTLRKFARREAIVQNGWAMIIVFGIIGASIMGVCVLFLVVGV